LKDGGQHVGRQGLDETVSHRALHSATAPHGPAISPAPELLEIAAESLPGLSGCQRIPRLMMRWAAHRPIPIFGRRRKVLALGDLRVGVPSSPRLPLSSNRRSMRA
jgi:hypothetical protein